MNKDTVLEAQDIYKKLTSNIHTAGPKKGIEETFGDEKVLFAAYLIAQFNRMNGQYYPDYSHIVRGYLNPENTCSVMADLRNDLAIKKCSEIMQSSTGEIIITMLSNSDIDVVSYNDLMNILGQKSIWGATMIMFIRNTHRTLQQMLATAAIEILKESKIIDNNVKSYLPMI